LEAEYFRTLFAYTYWVRDRLLDQVAQLSQDEYEADRQLDYKSIRGTLVHALSSEAGYLARWQGRQVDPPINQETVPTVAALRERWAQQEKAMRGFLAELTDEGTKREMRQVSRQTGREVVNPLWVLMAQLVNHFTQHRAEVALAITQLGHSPGDLDFSLYMRERSAA
jgi:uncharacterized damage-inducible protein DinB